MAVHSYQLMITFTKLLVVLTTLLAVRAGKNSCRQCVGSQSLLFNAYTHPIDALNLFESSLGSCATGKDYEVTSVVEDNCTEPCLDPVPYRECRNRAPKVCKKYTFNLKVWRYCGNGGSVSLRKTNHCSAGVCSASDYLSLTCYQSVECRGDCNCAQCGC